MDYRVWIGVSVKEQAITNIPIEKGNHHYFYSDKEAEKWAKVRVKRLVDSIRWYTGARYAILKSDGTYLEGRYN